MDTSIYQIIFTRLGWVVGLLATLFAIGVAVAVFVCFIRETFREKWWLFLPLGILGIWWSATSGYAHLGVMRIVYWSAVALSSVSVLYAVIALLALLRAKRAARLASSVWEGLQYQEREETFEFPLEKVRKLEHERRAHGFKPGWLYFQCRSDPELFEAFLELRRRGEIPDIEFQRKERDDRARQRAEERRNQRRTEQRSEQRNEGQEEARSATNKDSALDPYRVLDIPRGATQEEIQAAYREQMKLYHPDRVNHMGKAIKEVAEEYTKQIQRAYEMLRDAAA